ncbi:MAG: hypothetical protein AB1427_21415 [Thermodesulfobacteriota bacterium]
MQIRISIKGTPEELAEFCEKRGIDLQIMAGGLPASIKPTGQENVEDHKKIDKAFRKMSWETIYLAHLILLNAAPDQKDELGYYLTLNQIEKYAISERQVASRFGGAKRICKRLNLNYILFSRKRPDGAGKNYYVSYRFVSEMEDYLKKWDFEYREFLDDCGLAYPGS